MRLLKDIAWPGLAIIAAIVSGAPQQDNAGQKGFSYNRTTFLLDGESFQILGGQMDPQRIPPQYWRQRLQMARAMGLNTVFSYIFWNNIEPTPGHFDFTDRNDVAQYFRLAEEEGLKVVLRPGPYVCGEHDWGGFPSWLSQVPGMKVRENNEPFLKASEAFLSRLGKELRGLEASNGGPILMTQLENEYGSFDSDKEYLSALAKILRDNFDTFLYTNDGGGESYLNGGTLHGVLAETDGDPKTGFEARDKYVNDTSMLGPQLDGEYYVTWFDAWASNYTYQTSNGDPKAIAKVVDDLDWILSNGHSFNIYMFHGGTNWGFENGGIWGDGFLNAVTTSYDYGSPLDESGRPTEIYQKIREIIAKHAPADSIPKLPDTARMSTVPSVGLTPVRQAFRTPGMGKAVAGKQPKSMEELHQSYGYVLYEHKVTKNIKGNILPGDGPRDRVMVYVNGDRVGVVDRTYVAPSTVPVSLRKGDVLQLLVENLGRVDYSEPLREQSKGIVGHVTVDNKTVLEDWSMTSWGCATPPDVISRSHQECHVPENGPPVFYKGTFHTAGGPSLSRDTFLEIEGGIKGVVWVNGYNLGRYWTIGPQQSLYLPGCYLNDGYKANEIVVLELEPQAGKKLSVRGVRDRKWYNKRDPDAPQ